ncbi:MAG: DUF6268 family outer membrane beta-barrel protein [Bacteroidota bacterium]|nr:DUF6268 family outer membrane beta-barrel protein [Bacteroidota bacterium]
MNRNLYRSLVIILLSFSSLKSFGQEKSPFYIKYNHTPIEEVDGGHISQLEAQMLLPLYKGKTFSLATGITPEVMYLENFPMDVGNRLYGLGIPIGGKLKLNDRDEMFLATKMVLSSDLEDISTEDFTFAVGIGLHRKFSEKLTLGLGLGYSHQFFGNQLIPLFDFDYQISDKLHFYGRFPIEGTLAWNMGRRSTYGLEWNLGADSYRLSEETHNSEYLQYCHFNGTLFYTHRLYNNWHIKLSGGIAGQKYQWFNNSDSGGWTIVTIPLSDQPEPIEELKNNGFFVQIGFLYSF